MSAVGNFLKSAVGGLASSGGNPIGALASGVLGALGQSGNQGSVKNQQTTAGTVNQQSNQNTTGSTNGNFTNNTKQTEDPLMTMFRQQLMPTINQQISRAQQPVFDEGYKANFVNQLNDLGNDSMKSIQSNLARHGASNSGAAADAYSGLEQARFGNLSNFFSQLPFQEAQAQSARINPLLNLATGFAGHSLVDTANTGTQANNSTSNTNGTNNQQSNQNVNGTTTQMGAPFATNLANNLGAGVAGGSFNDMFKNLANKFGINGAPGGTTGINGPVNNNAYTLPGQNGGIA